MRPSLLATLFILLTIVAFSHTFFAASTNYTLTVSACGSISISNESPNAYVPLGASPTCNSLTLLGWGGTGTGSFSWTNSQGFNSGPHPLAGVAMGSNITETAVYGIVSTTTTSTVTTTILPPSQWRYNLVLTGCGSTRVSYSYVNGTAVKLGSNLGYPVACVGSILASWRGTGTGNYTGPKNTTAGGTPAVMMLGNITEIAIYASPSSTTLSTTSSSSTVSTTVQPSGFTELTPNQNATSGSISVKFLDLADGTAYFNVYNNSVLINQVGLNSGTTTTLESGGATIYLYLNSTYEGTYAYQKYVWVRLTVLYSTTSSTIPITASTTTALYNKTNSSTIYTTIPYRGPSTSTIATNSTIPSTTIATSSIPSTTNAIIQNTTVPSTTITANASASLPKPIGTNAGFSNFFNGITAWFRNLLRFR